MIHIGDDWYLDKDTHCFIIQRKGVVKSGENAGKETWTDHTYHSTHEQVIKHICDLALEKGINHDIVGMMEFLEGFKTKFKELSKFKR